MYSVKAVTFLGFILFFASCNVEKAKDYIFEINPGKPYEFDITSSVDGEEQIISLSISTDSTSWDIEGRESVMLTVYIDDEYNQDVVLFAGKEKFDYGFITGPLNAGQHRVRIEYSVEKSPAKDAKVFVYNVVYEGAFQEYMKYSPILYGRSDSQRDEPLNSYSDVGLILFATEKKKGNDTVYSYNMIWSNEDGGTGVIPPLLMAQYGRTTDIEWVYEVELDADKKIVSETFQKVMHTATDFTGQKLGLHPLLVVSSNNNNMEQDISAIDISRNIRYAMVSEYFENLRTREQVMDANPWTYMIANQEMKRESLLGAPKMESPGDPSTATLSDYRNYLFLEFDLYSDANLNWRFSALVNGVWYYSDHNVASFRYSGNGWGRSAIELPEGTIPESITKLSVDALDLATGDTAELRSLTAFMLDSSLVPQSPIIEIK